MMQADPDYVPERSVWVIVRDFEQEACFVLMLWAMAIMAYKGVLSGREQRLLEMDLVPLSEERFSLAGRIVEFRSFGKATFVKLADRTGRIQVYVRADRFREIT